jgi:hypothetical protein
VETSPANFDRELSLDRIPIISLLMANTLFFYHVTVSKLVSCFNQSDVDEE